VDISHLPLKKSKGNNNVMFSLVHSSLFSWVDLLIVYLSICVRVKNQKTFTNYTGRFIMFSVITNIYNKKPKGPTLMELFTATGKLNKFF